MVSELIVPDGPAIERLEIVGIDISHTYASDLDVYLITPWGAGIELFTDICGSTEMTERLGDDGAIALLHEHDGIVRDALALHDGREVKHTGDGIMASFASVSSAVEAAIAVQRHLAARDESPDARLEVRIGISAGEPVSDHDDLFGAAVQLAARLCSSASPRGISVSVAVRELCVGKRFRFEPRGPVALKGFAEPTHVYEVHWE